MAKPIEIKGAKELQKELKDLGRSFKMKVAAESLEPAGDIVERQIENNAPELTGRLKRNIKAKVDRTGKAVFVRVGVLDTSVTDATGRPVALYGGVQEANTSYMSRALQQTEGQAINAVTKKAQQELDKFHSRYPDRGKR